MDIFKGFNTNNEQRDTDWVALLQDETGGWVPKGPYSTSEVKQLMQSGVLKPTDYCWKQGWKDWRRIFEEASFYHSRKPPIEIKTVKKETIEFVTEKPLQYRTEIAEPIASQAQTETHKPMIEPWENAKGLAFAEASSEALMDPSVPTELSQDSLKNTQVFVEELEVESKKSLFMNKKTYLVLALFFTVAIALDFAFDGKVKQFLQKTEATLPVSYITVQDYSLETPRHLIVRTDLKKDEKLVVRLLNMDEKPIHTIKGGAGLIIPSKGSGQLRIPLYPYDLKPGSYKVWVQAGEAEVVKTFVIIEPTTPSPEA